MAIRRQTPISNTTIANAAIKQVNIFIYVETLLSEDGKMDIGVDIRCYKANQVLGQTRYRSPDLVQIPSTSNQLFALHKLSPYSCIIAMRT